MMRSPPATVAAGETRRPYLENSLWGQMGMSSSSPLPRCGNLGQFLNLPEHQFPVKGLRSSIIIGHNHLLDLIK